MGLATLTSPGSPITIVIAQMAALGTVTTSEHRKMAFGSIHNHPSWPTPPTETDHDFSQGMAEGANDKVLFSRASPHSENSIQSPPASPKPNQWNNTLPPIQSPPESPIAQPVLPSIKDRQLFEEPTAETQQPLFPAESPRIDSLSPYNDKVTLPVPKHQEAKFNIFPQFKDASKQFFGSYREDRYSELRHIPGWRTVPIRSQEQSPVTHSQRHEAARRQVSPVFKPNKVTKPATKPRRVTPEPRTQQKVARSARAAMRPDTSSPTPDMQSRKRAPATKKPTEPPFEEIEDFSPDPKTLNSMSATLSVKWKAPPKDISGDAEVRLLHPQEVKIASDLKLPARQYLAVKRMIFRAKLEHLKMSKNFTKTAAQTTCSIDVNKTSQLYEAFDRVGWFDEHHFEKFK